jgi:chemotaxis protein CheC
VPTIEFVSREELTRRLQAHPAGGVGRPPVSHQPALSYAATAFQTDALLLFPEHGSLEIVRRMLGDDTSIEHITELEQDALAEIGNIIINSCMSSLANLFGTEMIGSLPRVQSRTARTLLDDKPPPTVILVARIGMTMAAHNLSGFVLFIMDVPSIESLHGPGKPPFPPAPTRQKASLPDGLLPASSPTASTWASFSSAGRAASSCGIAGSKSGRGW